jgi:polyisoprenoid-binding protein YceI
VTAVFTGAQSSVDVLGYAPAMLAGELTTRGIPKDVTLLVAATAIASGVEAGCAKI